MKHTFSKLSNQVIGCAIEVHKNLGPGLIESAYQHCLCHELKLNKINFQTEVALPIEYKGTAIDCGYRMDILVEDNVVLELKSVDALHPVHEAQILSYMRLAKLKQGFLFNFNVEMLKQGRRD